MNEKMIYIKKDYKKAGEEIYEKLHRFSDISTKTRGIY